MVTDAGLYDTRIGSSDGSTLDFSHYPIPFWHNSCCTAAMAHSRKIPMTHASAHSFLEEVAARNPHQPEFIQAVTEVIESLWPFIQKNTKYSDAG